MSILSFIVLVFSLSIVTWLVWFAQPCPATFYGSLVIYIAVTHLILRKMPSWNRPKSRTVSAINTTAVSLLGMSFGLIPSAIIAVIIPGIGDRFLETANIMPLAGLAAILAIVLLFVRWAIIRLITKSLTN